MTSANTLPLFNMEEDYAAQKVSGPHQLTAEMRAKHKELQQMVRCEIPIRDYFRISDCDMLYRYLIARKWDISAAADAVKENNVWREKDRINSILTEKCEDWGDMPHFIGRDRDGHPVQYNAPNSQVLVELLKNKPKDILVRRHFIAMERARFLCKKYKSDRISCVVDLTNVGMNGITQVASFLKEMGTYDQKYYPETMRRMIVCNGGWAITGAWKGIKTFIDPRTQQKISFVSGPPSAKVLSEFIDVSQIPTKYGGTGDEKELTYDFSTLWNNPAKMLSEADIQLPQPAAAASTAQATSSPQKPVQPAQSPRLASEQRGLQDAAAAKAAVAAGFPPPATIVATKFSTNESPRMLTEEDLKSSNEAHSAGADDGGEGSDTESFYSMPSTDEDEDLTHSQVAPNVHGQLVSKSIIIHAENVCDKAIIEDEERQREKRIQRSLRTGQQILFHSNPRSAAAVDPMVLSTPVGPQPSPMTAMVSAIHAHGVPTYGEGRVILEAFNGPASGANGSGASSSGGGAPTAAARQSLPPGAANSPTPPRLPSISGASSSLSVSLPSQSLSVEAQMFKQLAEAQSSFTVTLGFSDGCFTASVGGVLLGRKMENVIMQGESDTLLMTIKKEAGHPVHQHHMLITPKRQVRYVLRKARVRDEIKVLDIHGDRTVTSVSEKGKCNGEKIDRYNISRWINSKDPRDWHLWRKGNRQGEEFYMWKEGRIVEVSTKMLLDGNTPETIIAMILALTTIWHAPCLEYD